MLVVNSSLGVIVKCVEGVDWGGTDSVGQRFLSLVLSKLPSQKKFNGSHRVELGAWVPHACKYLSHVSMYLSTLHFYISFPLD